jgi:hypothetical protein
MSEIKRAAFTGIGLVSIAFVTVGCERSDGATTDGDGVAVESATLRSGGQRRHRDVHLDGHRRRISCDGTGGRAGGGGAGAGGSDGAGGGTVGSGGVAITPDANGWIDASTNSLGIQGAWYVFADGYGVDGLRDGPCQAAGHLDSECSVLTTPDPALHTFPNTGGRMCTSGSGAQVLLLNGVPDYAHMWGAGMSFDFAGSGVPGQPKGVYNAQAHGIVGVAFDIDTVPPTGLRVGFPTPAFDASKLGAQYWGASQFFPNSPVVTGTNIVLFSQVRSPEAIPQPLDPTQIESLEFLAPTNTAFSGTFGYCISNVKMLLQ